MRAKDVPAPGDARQLALRLEDVQIQRGSCTQSNKTDEALRQ
jgi:hypothetical protein